MASCECGCGSELRRDSKGRMPRFLGAHRAHRPAVPVRSHSQGYVLVRVPEHPRAHNGYVYEHLIVAEKALGRPVPLGVEVHHVNESPADNRPSNLVICEDKAYHQLLHRRARALRACGHADWVRCGFCGRWDDSARMWVHPRRPTMAHHRECARAGVRARRSAA